MEKKLLVALSLAMLSGLAFAADETSSPATTADPSNPVADNQGHLSGSNEGMSGTTQPESGMSGGAMTDGSMGSMGSMPQSDVTSSPSTTADPSNPAAENQGHMSGSNQGMSGAIMPGADFDGMDANHDGMVSRSEYDMHMQQMPSMHGDAMHGDAMHGDAMGHGSMTPDPADLPKSPYTPSPEVQLQDGVSTTPQISH